ncbi:MAG: methyltransferase domain-containing protein [Streptosporangiales bacterium]|nr:methyltransferase domain-containing protein [Streptosporangiales bacterium]
MSSAEPLMTAAEAAAYWDTRHRRQDELRSGGHIGLDRAGNEMFYARRLGTLLEIIGDGANPADPLFLLDAGCGKGSFAHALARCGHRVDAIDASPSAISSCRRRAEETGPRFFVSSLSAWRSPFLYDVVYSIDVLFHILDDAEWEASLTNLASLVRLAGTLVVTDEGELSRTQRGTYILHRAREEYCRAVERRGLVLREFRPYGFRENRVGFYVFTRTH